MSVFYAILLAMVILFFRVVFRKLTRSNHAATPLMGWMVGLSFFLILPLAILVLNGGYELPVHYGVFGRWGKVDLSDPVYLYPFLVIWTSLMLTAAAVYVFTPKANWSSRFSRDWRLSMPRLRMVILVCTGIALTDWTVSIILMGGIQNYFLLHWYTRYRDALEWGGHLFVLYQHIAIAIQIVLTGATALLTVATIQRQNRSYGLLLLAFVILILNMIMTGNRIYIAMFMLYIITVLIVNRRYRLILMLGLVAPVIFIFFSAWAHIRGGLGDLSATIANYVDSKASDDNMVMSTLIDATEGANVMLLLHIIRDFGSQYDLLLGETYTKAITFVIPRSIYPDKPESFTVITAKLYMPESETSLSSTTLGEMYANFGIFAVLLLPMITVAILLISRAITTRLHRHALLSATLFLIFTWMARSVFSDNFIIILLSIAIIWGLRFEKGLLCSAADRQVFPPSLR